MSVDLAVIGLGYVGLPLAREAVRSGMSVIGVDVDAALVEAINGGRSHVDDLTDDDVQEMIKHGFRATTDESDLASVRTVVICVPTPLSDNDGPDLRAVVAAAEAVSRHLRPGMLVSLESTTYPGTTDDVVRPVLEQSGLAAGSDFHLAFSPERIDPGNRRFGPHNIPKVVGGYTEACGDRAAAFYRQLTPVVVRTKGTKEAEIAKLLENTYRHINIALVNEMVRFCHPLGIDLWDAIRAAATKPFGFQAFYPGPGVGGHCIPIDPNYLNHSVREKLGFPFRFVELAQEINATMPAYVAQRARAILHDSGTAVDGAGVLLLGVTYKPNIADHRESPAVPLAQALAALGARVSYHDPYVAQWRVPGVPVRPAPDVTAAVAAADLTILVQHHRAYDVDRLAARARRFFDTRGVTTSEAAHRL